MSPGARFDKDGNQLPETGHGCGCQICADNHAAAQVRPTRPWAAVQGRVVGFIKKLTSDNRPQTT